MDTDKLLELVPHYLAMLLLVFVVLGVVRATVEGMSIWVELVIVVVVILLYQFAVTRLGIAPSSWDAR